MQIILLERIEKLGTIGDVVNVKDGYARNYLLPNKKALRANDANRKVFEANRARIEADNASRRTDAEGHAKNVDGKSVVLIRASSNTPIVLIGRSRMIIDLVTLAPSAFRPSTMSRTETEP